MAAENLAAIRAAGRSAGLAAPALTAQQSQRLRALLRSSLDQRTA